MSRVRVRADLTPGERMVIWRRRLGLDRREAMDLLHKTWRAQGERRRGQVSLNEMMGRNWWWLARVERGDQEMPESDLPWTGERELTDAERCTIYRRRSGLKQVEVAERLEVSRLWVNMMERGKGPCGALLDLWEQS